MRLLTHTNIIVDDFEMCKDYPPQTFIHFLTHFHADHWWGMTPLWNYGIIFCTEITKRFILQKFPKIENIHTLDYNTPYYLDIQSQQLVDGDSDNKFVITIFAFDAHHIPGAAMYLFQGLMGTILHTGDFRYNPKMITQNSILFPVEIVKSKYKFLWENHQRQQKEESNEEIIYNSFINEHHNTLKDIAIPVDEMIYDNTYCNKMFNFPQASEVSLQMIEIIQSNPNKRVYIAMGAVGKEDICKVLSKQFQTMLVVTESKYNQMEASNCIDMSLFTTDADKGWIEIIKRNREEDIITNLKSFVKADDYICITIDFLMLEHFNPDGINFIVPYSLHSNYKEMETFVKSICPAILKKLVIPFETFPEYRKNMRIDFLGRFKGYIKKLEQDGQSGYSYFLKNHTNFSKVSKNYLQWMHEGITNELMSKLRVDIQPSRKYRKRKANQVEKMGRGEKIRQLSKEFGTKFYLITVFGKVQRDKKETLSDIADQLKGTNKNHSILSYLKINKNEKSIVKESYIDESQEILKKTQFQ